MDLAGGFGIEGGGGTVDGWVVHVGRNYGRFVGEDQEVQRNSRYSWVSLFCKSGMFNWIVCHTNFKLVPKYP